MSFSNDRNPSPPPEILEEGKSFVPDRIGSTLYSKRWLYETLMNMLKVVQECPQVEGKPNKNSSMETEELKNSNENIMELDTKIEENACTLWDMSANIEVAEFLWECNVADIFLTIIEHTKSPRLLEIVVGILGNMSSFNPICECISKNKALVHAIIMLSGCSDSCTLVQLFRLLTCGIVKNNSQSEWMKSFKENTFFMENLKSVLENNLCRNVLCGVLEFLEYILNYEPEYCSLWSEESYSSSIIQCGRQLLKSSHYEDLEIFFTVLNTLCQQRCNLPIYCKHFEALRPIFHAYFLKLGEEEYLPQIGTTSAVISSFAVYGNIIVSGNVSQEHIIFDDNLFTAMLNLCKKVKTILIKEQNYFEEQSAIKVRSVTTAEEEHEDSSDEDTTILTWKFLLDAIIHVAKACVPFTNKENELQILEDIIQFQNSTKNQVS